MLRRATINNQFLRRKKSLKAREKRRWLNDKDRYALSKTGGGPLHSWFTKARAFEILKELERKRNLHRLTINYKEEVISEFIKKGEEYSAYKTHQMIQDTAEIKNQLDSEQHAMDTAHTLPAHLMEELNLDDDKYQEPAELEYMRFYWNQIEKIIPVHLRRNWSLSLRLDDIAKDRIPHDED